MTAEELAAVGQERHGSVKWIRPFAQELGFDRTTIWKAARGRNPVSRELEQAVRLLPKRRKARQLTSQHQPHGDDQ